MIIKKNNNIFKNIFILSCAIFVVLIFLEIFSRNFIEKIPTKFFHFNLNALIWDREIGIHAFKKPSKSIMTNGHFQEYVFIDKNGFRVNSSEENITNPEIITIGDSQTFGHGISNKDTWPQLLAKSTNLSVGNLGVYGYNMHHYNTLITRLAKNFKPRYVIYGMTDNDICSLPDDEELEKNNRYKSFMNLGNQSHLHHLINFPKKYFLHYTSLGSLIYATYKNVFYRSYFGSLLRPYIRPKTVARINESCTMTTIKWLKEKSLFLKNYNINMIVIQIPFTGRIMSFAKGFHQENIEQSIKSIKFHQKDSFYFFIDPMKELSKHYKKNNYERASFILPVDSHNNLFSNKILMNLLKKNVNF